MAGRPLGAKNKTSIEIRELCQKHGDKVVRRLLKIVDTSDNDANVISAAREILDRGYGKPRQAVEVSGEDGGPLQVEVIRRVIVDARNPDAKGI